MKRDSGWDADASLLVQTNPPEGPTVLHVTLDCGEHVSGKYWLVQGRCWVNRCWYVDSNYCSYKSISNSNYNNKSYNGD